MANVTRQIVQLLFEQLLIRYADTIDPRVKEPSLSFWITVFGERSSGLEVCLCLNISVNSFYSLNFKSEFHFRSRAIITHTMFSFFERLFKYILVQILIVIFSILATLRLIYTYIINFSSIPWQPKDRILMEPPVCLSEKKYGVHKYVTVNVRIFKKNVFKKIIHSLKTSNILYQ